MSPKLRALAAAASVTALVGLAAMPAGAQGAPTDPATARAQLRQQCLPAGQQANCLALVRAILAASLALPAAQQSALGTMLAVVAQEIAINDPGLANQIAIAVAESGPTALQTAFSLRQDILPATTDVTAGSPG